MPLPIESRLSVGVTTTIHQQPEDGSAWEPTIDAMRAVVGQIDDGGFDSIWCGDHIAYTTPILDPLLQMAQAAVVSRRLKLGIAVYLLPLRHPVPVAKQVATLDHLTEGRLIFGVGIGGEFPKEFEACGVPLKERGARLGAAVPLLKQLWRGEAVSYAGPHWPAFDGVVMQPPARQPGGPPVWFGGRSDGALARIGRIGDGWISYVVTPEAWKAGLERIEAAALASGREVSRFGTAHSIFTRLDDSYEAALDAASATLSRRYAMDFRRATERYAALGTPEEVAARLRAFHAVGVRHLVISVVGPAADYRRQIDRLAAEVLPLLADLRRP